MLRASFGTTGYQGGDGGHGGRTLLVLHNQSRDDENPPFVLSRGGNTLEIRYQGDAELRNLKHALQWILKHLEAATSVYDEGREPLIENIEETSITVE